MPQKVEISYKTIVFTVFFLIFLWLLFQIKDILSLIFFSFIAAAGLRSPVNWLEERLRIPRVLAILLIYAVIIFVMFLFLAVMIPAFVQQTIRLVQELTDFFSISVLSPY